MELTLLNSSSFRSEWQKLELLTLSEAFLTADFAIATIAMFMSVLIMKLTRNPVKDKIYKTTRAGMESETKMYLLCLM